jgi:PleD family two-component response regulator
MSRCVGASNRLSNQERERPAAIVVDLFLPDSQGIETFDTLLSAAVRIPILILSRPQDEDIARLAVQYGAQDYLLKDRLDDHSLSKAVNNMLERATHAEALFVASERASYLAQHDFLTELPNRMLLNDRLTQAIAAARRHGASWRFYSWMLITSNASTTPWVILAAISF